MPIPEHPTPEGTGFGGAIGALVGGWPGLILGGAIGAALSSKKLTLEEALRSALSGLSLEFVSLSRQGPRGATLVFGSGRSYWSLVAFAGPGAGNDPQQVDDAIFDDLVDQLARWKTGHVAG